tara:strand:- start:1367 stop:1912 length:546 start_codon:yes stop_codon:yes gene_type:complete
LGRTDVVENIFQRVAVTHARIGGWFVLNHLVRVGVDEERFVEDAKATPVTQPDVTARTNHDTRLAFRTHATRERRFRGELIDHQLFAPLGDAERFAQHALIRPIDVVVCDPRFRKCYSIRNSVRTFQQHMIENHLQRVVRTEFERGRRRQIRIRFVVIHRVLMLLFRGEKKYSIVPFEKRG